MTNKEIIERLKLNKESYCMDCMRPQEVGYCENKCKMPEAITAAIETLELLDDGRLIEKDCERCVETYGTFGCCSTVNNEMIYSCEAGMKEYNEREYIKGYEVGYTDGYREARKALEKDIATDPVSKKDVISVLMNLLAGHCSTRTYLEVTNAIKRLPEVDEIMQAEVSMFDGQVTCPKCGQVLCV